MIKIKTIKTFACDMCGREYAGSKGEIVPKDVFEFNVDLGDVAKNVVIQICPGCQIKLKSALNDKLKNLYIKQVDAAIY